MTASRGLTTTPISYARFDINQTALTSPAFKELGLSKLGSFEHATSRDLGTALFTYGGGVSMTLANAGWRSFRTDTGMTTKSVRGELGHR